MSKTNFFFKPPKIVETIEQRLDVKSSLIDEVLKKVSNNRDICEKLVMYARLIVEWNEKFNLTAKTRASTIIKDLFFDSLKICDFLDFSQINTFCDVGTGAGIPGLVLKITNPEKKCVLIEVNRKKQEFLSYVCKTLELEDVTIIGEDWRTFNRQSNLDIDCFFTKAAFNDLEIIRMFRQNCNFKEKFLVYWSTEEFTADPKAASFVKKEISYTSSNKKFKFIFFSNQELPERLFLKK